MNLCHTTVGHQRATPFAALPLFLVFFGGCHHTVKISRNYPPPPVYDRGTGNRAPATQRTDPIEDASRDRDIDIPIAKSKSTEVGLASWYGPPYHNRRAANGEIYDQNAMTAAHRTLPMGTVIRVTNEKTGQSATVTITDRGPFVPGRVLDLSLAAAKATGVYRMGVTNVRIDILKQRADAGSGRWCVQIGAFLEAKHAEHLKSDLLRRYSDSAKVIEFTGPTGHWVRINPVSADRRRATQIADAIRPAEPAAQAYLVRLD